MVLYGMAFLQYMWLTRLLPIPHAESCECVECQLACVCCCECPECICHLEEEEV
jgi:hypothetical protein